MITNIEKSDLLYKSLFLELMTGLEPCGAFCACINHVRDGAKHGIWASLFARMHTLCARVHKTKRVL